MRRAALLAAACLSACGEDPTGVEVSEVEVTVRLLAGLQIDPAQTLFLRMVGGGQDLEVKVRRLAGDNKIALGPETRDFRPTPGMVVSLGAARNEAPPLVNLVGHSGPFESVLGGTHTISLVMAKGDRFSRAAQTTFDGAEGAVSLRDGRVVLFGGARSALPVAIYDHGCGEILFDKGRCASIEAAVGGQLPPRLRGASFTPMPGGRFFIYGGEDVGASNELRADGYYFDPASMTVIKYAASDQRLGRAEHAATYIEAWQRVVITGGRGVNGPLATVIVLDPRTGASEAAPILPGDGTTEARVGAVAAPLGVEKDKLLLAGGLIGGVASRTALVLRQDGPGRFTWSRPVAQSGLAARDRMLVSRIRHTLTPMPDGSVLVFGGSDGTDPVGAPEVFSEGLGAPGSFFSTQPDNVVPAEARERHSAVPVTRRDGGVAVVVGGQNSASSGLSGLVFHLGPAGWEVKGEGAPLSATSLLGPPLPRLHPVAALLPDGSLLVAGGEVKSAGSAGVAELLVECGNFWTCTE